MNWTKELPTEEGYYVIEEVFPNDDSFLPSFIRAIKTIDGLMVCPGSPHPAYPINRLRGHRFYGPIPRPKVAEVMP